MPSSQRIALPPPGGDALMRLCGICLVACAALAVCLLTACGKTPHHSGGVPGSRPYTVKGKTYYPLKSAHGFVEEGLASWYGPGFHGRRTASGERYDQEDMTAAHKILPLGTRVRVTNAKNKRSIVVRINDRGPFVDNRVIDLSHRAAVDLGIIGHGTAWVHIRTEGDVPNLAPDGDISGAFYVQVGAFGVRKNAVKLRDILTKTGDSVRIDYGTNRLWNVQIGPWPDSDGAAANLARIKALYPHAFVVSGD